MDFIGCLKNFSDEDFISYANLHLGLPVSNTDLKDDEYVFGIICFQGFKRASVL